MSGMDAARAPGARSRGMRELCSGGTEPHAAATAWRRGVDSAARAPTLLGWRRSTDGIDSDTADMRYKDYYAVMGVERDAPQDEIKRAYGEADGL